MNRKKIFLSMVPVYLVLVAAFVLFTHWGSSAVTVLAESTPVVRAHCIIIDPGHGGEDGGTTSCTGVLESNVNLQISLRLRDLLNLLGYDTLMIRTTDVSIYTKGETIAAKKVSDLKERVRIVNEAENALLISIHQNHFSDSKYSGAQVFYAATEGSEALAKTMQQTFLDSLNPGSRRQAKKSNGIYLMEHIDCAGILVECGFLSNPQEEANLRNPDYQKKVCCAIAASLSCYLANT